MHDADRIFRDERVSYHVVDYSAVEALSISWCTLELKPLILIAGRQKDGTIRVCCHCWRGFDRNTWPFLFDILIVNPARDVSSKGWGDQSGLAWSWWTYQRLLWHQLSREIYSGLSRWCSSNGRKGIRWYAGFWKCRRLCGMHIIWLISGRAIYWRWYNSDGLVTFHPTENVKMQLTAIVS